MAGHRIRALLVPLGILMIANSATACICLPQLSLPPLPLFGGSSCCPPPPAPSCCGGAAPPPCGGPLGGGCGGGAAPPPPPPPPLVPSYGQLGGYVPPPPPPNPVQFPQQPLLSNMNPLYATGGGGGGGFNQGPTQTMVASSQFVSQNRPETSDLGSNGFTGTGTNNYGSTGRQPEVADGGDEYDDVDEGSTPGTVAGNAGREGIDKEVSEYEDVESEVVQPIAPSTTGGSSAQAKPQTSEYTESVHMPTNAINPPTGEASNYGQPKSTAGNTVDDYGDVEDQLATTQRPAPAEVPYSIPSSRENQRPAEEVPYQLPRGGSQEIPELITPSPSGSYNGPSYSTPASPAPGDDQGEDGYSEGDKKEAELPNALQYKPTPPTVSQPGRGNSDYEELPDAPAEVL
ncbi:unnamed protein product, partial [Mesorhabditis spiculigera]